MPRATSALRRRWGIKPDKALAFLKRHGYEDVGGVFIRHQTEQEASALEFMFQEWDYGGPLLPDGEALAVNVGPLARLRHLWCRAFGFRSRFFSQLSDRMETVRLFSRPGRQVGWRLCGRCKYLEQWP